MERCGRERLSSVSTQEAVRKKKPVGSLVSSTQVHVSVFRISSLFFRTLFYKWPYHYRQSTLTNLVASHHDSSNACFFFVFFFFCCNTGTTDLDFRSLLKKWRRKHMKVGVLCAQKREEMKEIAIMMRFVLRWFSWNTEKRYLQNTSSWIKLTSTAKTRSCVAKGNKREADISTEVCDTSDSPEAKRAGWLPNSQDLQLSRPQPYLSQRQSPSKEQEPSCPWKVLLTISAT